jgi:hypothetical protein
MKVLIFKTDIETKKKVNSIKPLFDNHRTITNWYIDLEDRDSVLKIETSDDLDESDVIDLVTEKGYFCEVLPD